MRKTLLVAALVMAAGACGSSGHQSASTTTAPTTIPPAATTTTTVATSTTVAAGPGPCPTSRLSASLVPGGGGAAGSFGENLQFANIGSVACTLRGYPGVSFVTGSAGTQVGAAAVRQPGTPVTTVILAPGQDARAALVIVDSENYDQSTCQLTPVTGFRVYPPNQFAALFVPSPQKACANPKLTTLNIGPVTAP